MSDFNCFPSQLVRYKYNGELYSHADMELYKRWLQHPLYSRYRYFNPIEMDFTNFEMFIHYVTNIDLQQNFENTLSSYMEDMEREDVHYTTILGAMDFLEDSKNSHFYRDSRAKLYILANKCMKAVLNNPNIQDKLTHVSDMVNFCNYLNKH